MHCPALQLVHRTVSPATAQFLCSISTHTHLPPQLCCHWSLSDIMQAILSNANFIKLDLLHTLRDHNTHWQTTSNVPKLQLNPVIIDLLCPPLWCDVREPSCCIYYLKHFPWALRVRLAKIAFGQTIYREQLSHKLRTIHLCATVFSDIIAIGWEVRNKMPLQPSRGRIWILVDLSQPRAHYQSTSSEPLSYLNCFLCMQPWPALCGSTPFMLCGSGRIKHTR